MSIIYDALKKIEAKPGEAATQQMDLNVKVSHGAKIKIFLLVILVLAAGFYAANMLFSSSILSPVIKPSKQTAKQPVKPVQIQAPVIPAPLPVVAPEAPKPVAAKPEPQNGAFSLNGVFFSDGQAFALVNNQIVRQGDDIDGAKVLSVSMDGVELESAGSTIKLPTKK